MITRCRCYPSVLHFSFIWAVLSTFSHGLLNWIYPMRLRLLDYSPDCVFERSSVFIWRLPMMEGDSTKSSSGDVQQAPV